MIPKGPSVQAVVQTPRQGGTWSDPQRVITATLGIGGALLIFSALMATAGRGQDVALVVGLILLFSAEVGNFDYVKQLLPNREVRYTLLIIALALPAALFGYGRLYALAVQRGGETDFVESASGLAVDHHHPLSYLGRLGDSYVLYEASSKRVVIVQINKVGSLVLVPSPSK